MKTKKQVQAAVDAIENICKQHGIALVGTCIAEGIHGEIAIIDVDKLTATDKKRTQMIIYGEKESYVEAIGAQ